MTTFTAKLATFAAAAVVAVTALTGAASAQSGPYRHEHLVQGIVQNQIETVFDHREENARVIRAAYLAGFSYWYDSRCDFLPEQTFETIKTIVGRANQDADAQGTSEAVSIGLADAKAFLAEQGCATREAQGARASLTSFWQNTMQIIQNGENRAPARRNAPARGDMNASWGSDRNRM